MDFTIDRIEFVGLQKNVDYEIVTMVNEEPDDFTPFTALNTAEILSIIEKKPVGQPVKTMLQQVAIFPLEETSSLLKFEKMYLLTKDLIDFRVAVECGYGIVRMLKGEYAGQYFLYEDFPGIDYGDEEIDYRNFLLDIYLEIVSPYYHNPTLEAVINDSDGEDLIQMLSFSSSDYLVHKLDMAITLKKTRKNNFIQLLKN